MSVTDRVRDVLVDVDYPAMKDILVAEAEKHGADEDALRALRALPPVDYANADQVLRSIGTHARDRSGRTPADEGNQRRDRSQTGIAEHLKDTERSPIEEEIGSNRGS